MKCALVTGGSRGIGRSICYKMASMGYYTIVNYKTNEAEANNTLREIKEKGGDGEVLQFDVSSKEQVQALLGNWIEKNTEKYIEVLVNNAGINLKKDFTEVEKYLQRLQHMQLKNPVQVGFGIKDKQSFESACKYTSGAIIGTAYIKAIENSTDVQQSTKEFLRSVLQ